LDAILILLGVGLALFISVGSVLGFLAYQKRNEQVARVDALNLEVASLSLEVTELRLQIKHTQPPTATTPTVPAPLPEADDRVEPRKPSRIMAALKENWMVWLGGLSVALAIMGLSGAYLVPLLIGGEGGSVAFVLSYSFVITLSSLLLMRYVFRDWLWYATLAGALLWWAVTVAAAPAASATACYLAALFVVFAFLPGRGQAAPSRLREAFLPLLAIWGLSIAQQSGDNSSMWSWLFILPAASLIPQSRGRCGFYLGARSWQAQPAGCFIWVKWMAT